MKKEPRLFFYDFECFSRSKDPITGRSFWLVVFIEYKTRKGKVIVNNDEELIKFYNKYKDDIFIGFNSRSYDQFLLKGLVLGMDAGYINDKIIIEGKKGYEVVRNAKKVPLNNFDIMPNPPVGLKTLEGFLGLNIKESSVPFDLDRPLTKDEIKETIDYCVHDVKCTISVFEAKNEEFTSQLGLIEMFNLDMTQFTKTKAQLSAFILGAEKQDNRDDEYELIFPNTLKIEKYKHIMDWYKNPENMDYNKKLKVDVAGVEHIFGWGGLHSAIPNYQTEGIILCCDVASLYPSIMINYNFLSRNVKEPAKFKEIRDTRLELKAKKDKNQAPLKIVINATFGASKDIYNALYDPLMANNVCVAGQLLLLDLIEKVEPYCQIFNTNTDGIFMKVENTEDVEKIKEAAKEWEIRTGLDLEWDEFVKAVQKDVNGYILIDKNGKYKSKGAYLKKLNDLDYDLPIINKALINYFTKQIPIDETINNCDELREFQKIVKLKSPYKNAYKNCTFSKKKVLNEKTGKMVTKEVWDENGEILKDKTFRVFASTRDEDGAIYKKKKDKNPEKFANTPEKAFINNDDIKGVKIPEYLDKQYYIDLSQERINQFLGIKKKAAKKKKDEKNSENS